MYISYIIIYPYTKLDQFVGRTPKRRRLWGTGGDASNGTTCPRVKHISSGQQMDSNFHWESIPQSIPAVQLSSYPAIHWVGKYSKEIPGMDSLGPWDPGSWVELPYRSEDLSDILKRNILFKEKLVKKYAGRPALIQQS